MAKPNYLSELFGKPMGFLCDMLCLQEKGNLVAVAEKEIWACLSSCNNAHRHIGGRRLRWVGEERWEGGGHEGQQQQDPQSSLPTLTLSLCRGTWVGVPHTSFCARLQRWEEGTERRLGWNKDREHRRLPCAHSFLKRPQRKRREFTRLPERSGESQGMSHGVMVLPLPKASGSHGTFTHRFKGAAQLPGWGPGWLYHPHFIDE